MNIDLQRSNTLPRDRRCLMERQTLKLQQLDGLALSTAQSSQRLPDCYLIVAALLLILRFNTGKGFWQHLDRRFARRPA